MNSKNLPKYRVVIAFHETLPCYQAESLKKYFLDKYRADILFIGHPLLDIQESYQGSSRYEYYRNNQQIISKKAFQWDLPKPLLYVKDMIYTCLWCLKYEGLWDIFFGVDNIGVLVALFLKKLGKVKKVVYHTIDYYPNRFQNKFLNWLYFQFDKICVKYADETWNVGLVMAEARERKMGMKMAQYNRQYLVPMCVWVDKVQRKSFDKINKRKIVYRGSLVNIQGVDLIIKAMPVIIKAIRGTVLEIYGDGVERKNLERLVNRLKVSRQVKFHGWIRDREELEKLMSDGALGVATFNTKILDDTVKNADPSKIKDYTLMGMPVITTRALSTFEEIEKFRCGIVINYEVKDLARAVIKLLSDNKLLKEYRQNALRYIKQYDCCRIFDENVTRILSKEV